MASCCGHGDEHIGAIKVGSLWTARGTGSLTSIVLIVSVSLFVSQSITWLGTASRRTKIRVTSASSADILDPRVIAQRAEVAQGVPGRLRPRIILTFRHYKGGRSSAVRTGRLYPRRNPWYSLSEAKSWGNHGKNPQ